MTKLLLANGTDSLLLVDGTDHLLLTATPPPPPTIAVPARTSTDPIESADMTTSAVLKITLPPPPVVVAPSSTYYVPDTIPADGSVDVTADLNAWIASLPNGTLGDVQTYVFSDVSLTPKLFRVDGTLLMDSKQYVTFAGSGSTFQRILHSAVRSFPHVLFRHCHNYAYNDMRVIGEATGGDYSASLEAQHAFAHASSSNATSSGCYADAVWGDGLNYAIAGFGPSDGWCDSHTVDSFSTGLTHRDPVVITSGSHLTFTNCTFGSTPRTGCDMEPNSSAGGATDILFDTCTWHDHRFNVISATSSGLGNVSRITINNCQSIASPFTIQVGDTVLPGLRADWTITNCSSNIQQGGPSGAVMAFCFASGTITVTGNHNPLQSGRTPSMHIARFDASTTANATIIYSGNTPADFP